jgi:ABC-2 type transport system permease protein
MPFVPRVRPYVQYARCAFQRRAAYRLANWTGIAVNFFFFLIHAQIYFAFFAGRAEVVGWSASDAILYFAISESLLMVIGVFPSQGGQDLMERIRSGDVSLDLARPVELYGRDLAERFGSAGYFLLARTTVLYLGCTLVYGLSAPVRIELLLWPISLALAIGISGSLTYLACATAFWTEHAQGPVGALTLVGWFFGGAIVPIDFYPGWLQLICDLLPFRGALYAPLALGAGKLAGGALAFSLLHQIVWFGLLAIVARAVEARGVRRLVLHGG